MPAKHRCQCFPTESSSFLYGLRREAPSTDRVLLERLLNVLSRAAAKHSSNPQKLWAESQRPDWWPLITKLPWKNPREHPKDNKDVLKKKILILEEQLKALDAISPELQEEILAHKGGKKIDLELKSDFEAAITKASGLHYMLQRLETKLGDTVVINEKIASYIQQARACLDKSLGIVSRMYKKVERRQKYTQQLWEKMGVSKDQRDDERQLGGLSDGDLEVDTIDIDELDLLDVIPHVHASSLRDDTLDTKPGPFTAQCISPDTTTGWEHPSTVVPFPYFQPTMTTGPSFLRSVPPSYPTPQHHFLSPQPATATGPSLLRSVPQSSQTPHPHLSSPQPTKAAGPPIVRSVSQPSPTELLSDPFPLKELTTLLGQSSAKKSRRHSDTDIDRPEPAKMPNLSRGAPDLIMESVFESIDAGDEVELEDAPLSLHSTQQYATDLSVGIHKPQSDVQRRKDRRNKWIIQVERPKSERLGVSSPPTADRRGVRPYPATPVSPEKKRANAPASLPQQRGWQNIGKSFVLRGATPDGQGKLRERKSPELYVKPQPPGDISLIDGTPRQTKRYTSPSPSSSSSSPAFRTRHMTSAEGPLQDDAVSMARQKNDVLDSVAMVLEESVAQPTVSMYSGTDDPLGGMYSGTDEPSGGMYSGTDDPSGGMYSGTDDPSGGMAELARMTHHLSCDDLKSSITETVMKGWPPGTAPEEAVSSFGHERGVSVLSSDRGRETPATLRSGAGFSEEVGDSREIVYVQASALSSSGVEKRGDEENSLSKAIGEMDGTF